MARPCSDRWLRCRRGVPSIVLLALGLGLWFTAGIVGPGQRLSAATVARARIHWTAAPSVRVELSGLTAPQLATLRSRSWSTEDWQQFLRVSTLATNVGQPAMAGEYEVTQVAVVFRPQFPIVPGVPYRAVVDLSKVPGAAPALGGVLTSQFTLQRDTSGRATLLDHIYPSAGVLPENQLKFYLHFSSPMSRGHIYDYIHLREESGREVELPFLQINEELWSPDLRRLTLLIDPGRIKRGVRPLEEVGPALQNGHRYRLDIDPGWQDASGRPLGAAAQKVFHVGPPDRSPPDPAQWKLEAPRAGRRTPLRLLLPKPMDQALLLRLPRVVDESGRTIPGLTVVDREERRWSFTPGQPWAAGRYAVVVPTTIEDLAGNNIGKPFEVDLFEQVDQKLQTASVDLAFQVR
jgi:hypothetical protein